MRTYRVQRAARRRGVALLLTMIVVTIAFVLAMALIRSESRSTPIATSIGRHAAVRLAAESGLELALGCIEQNAGWRDALGEGAWFTDLPLGEARVTVDVEDGEDLDGDGVIDIDEGDGDLADDDSDPVTITATAIGAAGETAHRVRLVLRPGAAAGLSAFVTTGQGFKFNSNAYIDSFDSRLGRYGPLNNGSAATVRTNATANKAGDIGSQGAIRGNAYAPPGTNPNQVYNPPGKVTGSLANMDAVVEMPTVTVPTAIAPDSGWLNLNNTVTLSSNRRYQGINFNSGGRLVINGDVTLVVTGSINLGGNGIELNPGAKLTLYVNQMNLNSNARLNANTGEPGRVTLYLTGSSDTHVNSGAELWAQIVAPNANLNLNSGGHVYGTFIGKHLNINGGAAFHQDVNPAVGIYGEGAGGGATEPTVRWVELD